MKRQGHGVPSVRCTRKRAWVIAAGTAQWEMVATAAGRAGAAGGVASGGEKWTAVGTHHASSFRLLLTAPDAATDAVGAARFVIRTTRKAWGWCAAKSELDGRIS
ncbi:hypothetical protein IWX75_001576 [Arthrobacter sp. CAN_A6]